MSSFVKAIEIWKPDQTGQSLTLHSSYYSGLDEFMAVSEPMTFAYDEGLPGKTWAAAKPVILSNFEDSYFKRQQAAQKAGLVCALSLPVFAGEILQAVMIIFFAGGTEVSGAIEVWNNSNNSDNELKLADGYYGELERFEWISKRLTIIRGRGLPGAAWEQAKPVIIEDLGQANSFLRARNAAEAGITTGLAIPWNLNQEDVRILTLLSAKGSPIAKQFEIWQVDSSGDYLTFRDGHSESADNLHDNYRDQKVSKGEEDTLGIAWLTGLPSIVKMADAEEDVQVVIPVLSQGKLNAIIRLFI